MYSVKHLHSSRRTRGLSGIDCPIATPYRDDGYYEAIIFVVGTGHYVNVKSWITDYGYMYNDIQMVRSIMYLSM
ncbi:MAG: hypothetical protein ACTS8Y_05140, partial [Arsenophonus sp. ER-EMS1-MAG3]